MFLNTVYSSLFTPISAQVPRLERLVHEFPRFFDGIQMRYKKMVQHDHGDAWGEQEADSKDAAGGDDLAGRSNAEILQQVMTKREDGTGGNLGAKGVTREAVVCWCVFVLSVCTRVCVCARTRARV